MVECVRKCVLVLCCLALGVGLSACSEDEINGVGIGGDSDVEVDGGTDAGDLDSDGAQDTGGESDGGSDTDVGGDGPDAGDEDTGNGPTDVGGEEDAGDAGGVDAGGDADTGDFDAGGDVDAGGDMDAGGDADVGGEDVGDDADAGDDDAGGDDPPPGLSEPCENGPGWTVFRFFYNNNSTSAQIEVWDASCNYSLATNSACNVREVTSGFGDISRTSEGFPIVTGSDYIRVRYSVEGLAFDVAEVHLKARSVSTSASTDYELWSPIYGSVFGGPVSVGFDTQWYNADWSDHLSPTDDPDLTAIQIYADGGSGQMAVESVELCVE